MSLTLDRLCSVKPILIVSPVIGASRVANIIYQEGAGASQFSVISFFFFFLLLLENIEVE